MKIDMMKINDILRKLASGTVNVLRAIADGIIPSDNLMRVTSPYTRQSFSKNVRENNSGRKYG